MSNLEKTLENPSPFGMVGGHCHTQLYQGSPTLGRNQTLVE